MSLNKEIWSPENLCVKFTKLSGPKLPLQMIARPCFQLLCMIVYAFVEAKFLIFFIFIIFSMILLKIS